jgi:hypothetical protein
MQVELGKLSKVVGSVVLGLFFLGMLVNSKDIRRYMRMSMM